MNIKINGTLYPCTIKHTHVDYTWGNRESQSITLEMDATTAASLFVDEAKWSIVNGEIEFDGSDYCVAGPITDNRNGTVTVKMGKPTDAELLAIIMGGN